MATKLNMPKYSDEQGDCLSHFLVCMIGDCRLKTRQNPNIEGRGQSPYFTLKYYSSVPFSTKIFSIEIQANMFCYYFYLLFIFLFSEQLNAIKRVRSNF